MYVFYILDQKFRHKELKISEPEAKKPKLDEDVEKEKAEDNKVRTYHPAFIIIFNV